MHQLLVNKSLLKGEIVVPPSKSHTLRALLFGSLAKGKTYIHHFLESSDTESMIQACISFGAKITYSSQTIEIEGIAGNITHTEDVINAGNSGLVLRFCSAIGALSHKPVVVTGDASIRHQRPMKELLSGLRQLGASAISMRGDDYAPVIISGPISHYQAIINGEDSQPVSALLILAAFAAHPITIKVNHAGELPWINMTLDWFKKLHIPFINHHFQQFELRGNQAVEGFDYSVPGDFSSCAFPIAAAIISNSELTIKNIDMQDCQGDKELITTLQKMGAKIEIDEKNKILFIRKNHSLKGMKIDINSFIDSITILAVIACFADGETHIYNATVAKFKECNRIACIAKELRKMGADIIELDDGLKIKKSHLKSAHLETYHDHRMAMSLAVAAMGAEGESTLSSVQCISKTFPTFIHDFSSLGANLRLIS